MAQRGIQVVTGAFSYSGRYIAQRLLDRGHVVRTLTNSPRRPADSNACIQAYPLSFTRSSLAHALAGAEVLYNTYWTRYDEDDPGFAQAVANSRRLLVAAREAGVRRIVQLSVTNTSLSSPFPCFRGKAEVEGLLDDLGLSHAILRPALIYGGEGKLINNLAWVARHFSRLAVFGDGGYRVRPIFVEDLAALAVELGERDDSLVMDAVGPDTLTYRELVQRVGARVGCRGPVMSIPPWLALRTARLLRPLLKEAAVTRDELGALMAELLFTEAAPAGLTRFSDWLEDQAPRLGIRYFGDSRGQNGNDAQYPLEASA
jgi:NADH dehydrogenase